MSENIKLCMGCMNPLDDSLICPNCGYTDNIPYLPSYLAPKTILNERYIVGKLLSYNGEGAIYISYDKVTNTKVLIKEYMPDTLCTRVRGSAIISVNANTLAQYKTFMAEFTQLNKVLSRMRTLSHINPALDLFAQNNTTYVVLEYIDGITLKQFIQDNAGELTWEQVKKLFPPIFTTLSLIHNAGIVHRGISLDTIYYTSKGELKLGGFSIIASRTANTEIASELFAGYAAPEQYSSTNWQGTWTDVYAIAAVLYRSLTGCMPTEAVSRIGNDNLLEPCQINPNVPANVSKVIMGGLILSGDMRIQTITELVTKLFEQFEYMEQPHGATQTIPIQRPHTNQQQIKPKNKETRKITFTIAAVTLVLLLATAIIMLMLLGDSEDDNLTPAYTTPVIESSIEDRVESSTVEEVMSLVDSSEEKPTMLMMNLVGKDYDLIKGNANYTEWMEFTVIYDYNEQFENGFIYEQDVKENTEISAGTKVNIKVSLGPQYAVIPDFQGRKEKDYLTMLGVLNIKYSTQTIETQDVMTGYIAKTGKAVGDKVDLAAGEVLIVYIAHNPEITTTTTQQVIPVINENSNP